MALTQPTAIPMPFADEGDKATIPSTTADEGRATWKEGFPEETATPIASGGVPPHRLDFQGVLNALSSHIFWQQSGSLYTWSNALDYAVGAHVLGSDGKEYVCLTANGVSGTVKNPTTDTARTYWKPLTFVLADFIYPVGAIYMSVSSTSPATLFGGTWQRLNNRFLIGATDGSTSAYPVNATGGSTTKNITVANIPSHNHSGTTNSNGNHDHGRGSMEITGIIPTGARWTNCSGAFAFERNGEQDGDDDGSWGRIFNFRASRTWTGRTSVNGAHTHTITTNNTGSGSAMDIMPPYLAVYMWKRTA